MQYRRKNLESTMPGPRDDSFAIWTTVQMEFEKAKFGLKNVGSSRCMFYIYRTSWCPLHCGCIRGKYSSILCSRLPFQHKHMISFFKNIVVFNYYRIRIDVPPIRIISCRVVPELSIDSTPIKEGITISWRYLFNNNRNTRFGNAWHFCHPPSIPIILRLLLNLV